MNKKGNTLVEVIVSILIVSIIVTSLMTVYASSRKISFRLSFNENIVSEIENLNSIFTSDPSNFLSNFSKEYNNNYQIEKQENENVINQNIKIFFNKNFGKILNNSNNYIGICFSQSKINLNVYELKINVFNNNVIINKFSFIDRKIIDSVGI